jgi:hypothetical protein
MRGDSIRDLYAKTLALLGLGLLAGTGALVDYWPSRLSVLPVASPALVMPESAWLLPEPVPVLPTFPRTAVASALPSDAPEFVSLSIPVSSSSDVVSGRAVALAEPFPVAVAMIPVETFVPSGEGEEVVFHAPLEEGETPVGTIALSAAPVALSADDDRDSFIAGASKRIGASIMKGGAKTGASFVDMVRVVNRTLRRVLPG